MAEKEEKQPRQTLYMDNDLKQKVVIRAKRNNRSLNKEIIHIIQTTIEQDQQKGESI